MDPFSSMKEDYVGCGSGTTWVDPRVPLPQPRDDLHEMGPTPFLTKTYDMVDSMNTNHIISWNRGGSSFVVWDPDVLCMELLPICFKHNNFSSFIRQLNTYGFKKIDPQKWEFANELFLKGEKHLLKNIKRKRIPPPPLPHEQLLRSSHHDGSIVNPSVELEVNHVRHDKQVLVAELIKQRHQQQNIKANIQAINEKLQNTEHNQQDMMSLLAKTTQNPACLQRLAEQMTKRKEHEANTCGDELETLALQMQGYISEKREVEEKVLLDEAFWNDLINNENFKKEFYMTNTENEDINMLDD